MSRQEPSENDITSRVAAASAPHAGQRYPSTGTDFASTGHSVSPIETNLLTKATGWAVSFGDRSAGRPPWIVIAALGLAGLLAFVPRPDDTPEYEGRGNGQHEPAEQQRKNPRHAWFSGA